MECTPKIAPKTTSSAAGYTLSVPKTFIDEEFIEMSINCNEYTFLDTAMKRVLFPDLLATEEGGSLFGHYVAKGSQHVVEIFLKNGANPNGSDWLGTPYLSTAVSGCHREVTELLLKYGANTNCIAELMPNAAIVQDDILEMAASIGNVELMRQVLTVKFSQEQLDKALFHSRQANASIDMLSGGIQALEKSTTHLEIADLLVSRGAKLKLDNQKLIHKKFEERLAKLNFIFEEINECQGVFAALQMMDPKEVCSFLNIDAGATKSQIDELVQACEEKNVDELADALDQKLHVKEDIFTDARNGNQTQLEHLLITCSPNIRDKEKIPLLIHAISSGNTDTIELVLDKGADPNVVINGKSPLEIALYHKNWDAVKLLIQHKSRVMPAQQGELFTLAMKHGCEETLKSLLEHRKNTEVMSDLKVSDSDLLAMAIRSEHKWKMIVHLFREEIEIPNGQVCTLLNEGVNENAVQAVNILLMYAKDRHLSQQVLADLFIKAIQLQHVHCVYSLSRYWIARDENLFKKVTDAALRVNNKSILQLLGLG